MNKNIGGRLKYLRESLGIKNQTKFAEKLEITQTSLSKYENETVDIPDNVKMKIAELGVNLHWLLTGDGDVYLPKFGKNPEEMNSSTGPGSMIDQRLEKIEARMTVIEGRLNGSSINVSEPEPEYGPEEDVAVPFVGSIAAGPPTPQSDNVWDYIKVPRRLIKSSPKDYYAARIEGESMPEAGVPDGSMVLIQKADVPKDRAIQVVRRGGSSTLKRMREHEDHRWTLQYEDGSNRFIELGPDEEYQVQGDFVAILPEDRK